MFTPVCDDRNALLVVARDDAVDFRLARWTEAYPLSNTEIQHLHVGAHLPQKAQPRNHFLVQFDEFFFGEPVDVHLQHEFLITQ